VTGRSPPSCPHWKKTVIRIAAERPPPHSPSRVCSLREMRPDPTHPLAQTADAGHAQVRFFLENEIAVVGEEEEEEERDEHAPAIADGAEVLSAPALAAPEAPTPPSHSPSLPHW
jgi:hypothetical protein